MSSRARKAATLPKLRLLPPFRQTPPHPSIHLRLRLNLHDRYPTAPVQIRTNPNKTDRPNLKKPDKPEPSESHDLQQYTEDRPRCSFSPAEKKSWLNTLRPGTRPRAEQASADVVDARQDPVGNPSLVLGPLLGAAVLSDSFLPHKGSQYGPQGPTAGLTLPTLPAALAIVGFLRHLLAPLTEWFLAAECGRVPSPLPGSRLGDLRGCRRALRLTPGHWLGFRRDRR